MNTTLKIQRELARIRRQIAERDSIIYRAIVERKQLFDELHECEAQYNDQLDARAIEEAGRAAVIEAERIIEEGAK